MLALPEPSQGDLFFDIEGARYYSEDSKEFGLQYLFGIVDTAEISPDDRPRHRAFWAFDRPDEKRAFEALINFIIGRLDKNPGLHVYHYNHYEPTAMVKGSTIRITPPSNTRGSNRRARPFVRPASG